MNDNAFVSLVNLLKRGYEEAADIDREQLMNVIPNPAQQHYHVGRLHGLKIAMNILQDSVKKLVTAEDLDDIS